MRGANCTLGSRRTGIRRSDSTGYVQLFMDWTKQFITRTLSTSQMGVSLFSKYFGIYGRGFVFLYHGISGVWCLFLFRFLVDTIRYSKTRTI
jgi:hypothetical protein